MLRLEEWAHIVKEVTFKRKDSEREYSSMPRWLKAMRLNTNSSMISYLPRISYWKSSSTKMPSILRKSIYSNVPCQASKATSSTHSLPGHHSQASHQLPSTAKQLPNMNNQHCNSQGSARSIIRHKRPLTSPAALTLKATISPCHVSIHQPPRTPLSPWRQLTRWETQGRSLTQTTIATTWDKKPKYQPAPQRTALIIWTATNANPFINTANYNWGARKWRLLANDLTKPAWS